MQADLNSAENLQKKGKVYSTFVICFIATMVCGTVSTLMSTYLPVAVKDLVGDMDEAKFNNTGSLISALFLYGWMFGGIAWGIICDKTGRAKAVVLSTAFYGIFTVLTGLSPTWFWVMVCRFFTGFGIGGVLLTTNVLVAEMWPAKRRAVALGVLSISFPIGIFSAGLIEHMVHGWRWAFNIGIIPIAAAIASIWLLAESQQWQESKNNATRSQTDVQDPQYRRNLVAGSIIFGGMLIGMWAIFSWLPTWVQSIVTTGDARHERGMGMMLIGIGGLSGGFISGWVVNWLGLRKTMMLCFAVCFVMAFCLFKLDTTFNNVVFPEIAVLAVFFGISQGALSLYIPQLFKTAVRAYATGISFNVGRLFTATVVFFIGSLVTILGGYGNSIFTFSFVFLIGLVTTFFSKEKATNHL